MPLPQSIALDDASVREEDVRRLLERLRGAVEDEPALGLLLEDPPDELATDRVTLTTIAEREEAFAAAKRMIDAEAERLTRRLYAGNISAGEWRRRMKQLVKDMQVAGGVAGRSGRWDALQPRDWGRIGQVIRQQYSYLQRFAEDLQRPEEARMSEAEAISRTRLYTAAAHQSWEAQRVAEYGIDPGILPGLPADGRTRCLTNCRCRWAVQTLSKENGDFNVRWRLQSSESCKTCIRRQRSWRLKVRSGRLTEQPEPIYYDHV